MQRLIALLLLASFSLPLTLALQRANPEANLPACCRRNGKHACSMRKQVKAASSAGPAFSIRKLPCADYPSGNAVFASAKAASPLGAWIGFALPATRGAATALGEILLRTSLAGACPQRGPPGPVTC